MIERKQIINKSPDIRKLQEVVIDNKTKIYIDIDADPIKARNRFLERVAAKGKIEVPVKKQVVVKS